MNTINLSIKILGKKRPAIKNTAIEIENSLNENSILKDLITEVVKSQVNIFNQKREGENVLNYLSPNDIADSEKTGKIAFGEVYNKEKADLEKAIETAIQAFEDGLYFVFIDDKKLETLDTKINLTENSNVTFIRLTALTGGYF